MNRKVGPASRLPPSATPTYLFSVIAARANEARTLVRWKAAWRRRLEICRRGSAVQAFLRDKSRAPAEFLVGGLNTYTPTERNRSRWRARRAGGTPALRLARSGSWAPCIPKSERRTSGEWVRGAIVRVSLFAASGWLFTLSSRAADLTVFAAASLSDALKEIAVSYERKSDDRIVFNFGASSMLARQIQEGAPADVFFSADESRMDVLEKAELILKETRRSRLSNSLVIVVAGDSPLQVRSAEDLADARVKRIALADPKAVPAGVYARAYLEQAKIWPAVQGKIVPTENVRAALAAVESGNVDAGIVYKTDAAVSAKIKVAYAVKAEEGPEISYPMAVLKESARIDAAKKFVRYLESVGAEKIFEKYGFIVRKSR